MRTSDNVQIRATMHTVKGARGTTHFFSYNLRGRRVRSKRYKDEDVARLEMRRVTDEYEARTPFQATTLSRLQLDDAQGAFLTLKRQGIETSLGEIVAWYVKKAPRIEAVTLNVAVSRFLASLPAEMRDRTKRFYTATLTPLRKKFGDRQLAELTTEDFRQYLNSPIWGTISRWHHRQVASRLFLWAMKKENSLAMENPLTPLPKMTKKGLRKVLHAPLVLTPKEAKNWLKAAVETPHLGYSILALFAGMRRQEIQLFAKEPDGGWGAIDFGSKTISIAPEIGKTGLRMIHMHPTLADWLRWLQKKGKPLFLAPNFNKGLRAIKGVVFPPGTDGTANIRALKPNLLRHSFISYSLRLPGASFAAVAMNAGNTEAMIREHYNSLQSTQEQALEYWGLTPRRILKAAGIR